MITNGCLATLPNIKSDEQTHHTCAHTIFTDGIVVASQHERISPDETPFNMCIQQIPRAYRCGHEARGSSLWPEEQNMVLYCGLPPRMSGRCDFVQDEYVTSSLNCLVCEYGSTRPQEQRRSVSQRGSNVYSQEWPQSHDAGRRPISHNDHARGRSHHETHLSDVSHVWTPSPRDNRRGGSVRARRPTSDQDASGITARDRSSSATRASCVGADATSRARSTARQVALEVGQSDICSRVSKAGEEYFRSRIARNGHGHGRLKYVRFSDVTAVT
jgi:hypothetical protein